MNDETIVAVYDTAAHAEAAAADLRNAGIPDHAINLHAGNSTRSDVATAAPHENKDGFWSRLFGNDAGNDAAVYDRSLSSGSTVVTVKTPETHVDRVLEILEGHNPVDIDERASEYGLAPVDYSRPSYGTSTQPMGTAAPVMGADATATGTTNPAMFDAAPASHATPAVGAVDRASVADGGTIQLAEENLEIGKRVVNRGGTRIRRYVVETPFEEHVTLRDEAVTLDRRPVTDGRVAHDAFSEKSIEMTATAEEAVVSKTSRVVEEIGLRKEATDRVETVRDTLRREEVEVEEIPGGSISARTADTRRTDI